MKKKVPFVFICWNKIKNLKQMCVFQECPCLVDKDFLASLQSFSVTPVSSLLLHNVSEGVELQTGETLVHDCSTWWAQNLGHICRYTFSIQSHTAYYMLTLTAGQITRFQLSQYKTLYSIKIKHTDLTMFKKEKKTYPIKISIQVSWKYVQKFLFFPADKPTN